MAKSSNQIADAIRELRRQLGLTQVQLAGLIGLTPTTIHRYESGARPDTAGLHSLFALSEKHSLSVISNIFQSEMWEHDPVAKAVYLGSRRMMTRLAELNDERPHDPIADAVIKALADLPERDKVIALAFMAFLGENTDLTADSVIRHLLQKWITRTEKLVGAAPGVSRLPK